jgi:hypothetical protein
MGGQGRIEEDETGVTVLHARGGDEQNQQQAGGVHGDVPFAAVDLLAGVVAAVCPWDSLGAADALVPWPVRRLGRCCSTRLLDEQGVVTDQPAGTLR